MSSNENTAEAQLDAQASPDAESNSKEAEKLEWRKILIAIQIKDRYSD